MKLVLIDILLISAMAEIYASNQALRRHRVLKRETQAGYTQDPDTCQKYNANLGKMWEKLSEVLNSTDSVNTIALHNIAVMVEAYLDHQHKHRSGEIVTRQKKKGDKISQVLKNVKKMLGKEDATENVKKIILENFEPKYDPDDPECQQTNEDNLVSSIALSYQNYLDNAKCRGDYDTGLLRGKALLRRRLRTKPDAEISTFRDVDDIDGVILYEDELFEDYHRGKSPKYRDDITRRIGKPSPRYTRGRFNYYRRSRARPILRSKPRKSGKRKSRFAKKSHVRSDESCVKYAKRKFLITLRTSVERFIDLRDCQHDDTLRMSRNREISEETNAEDEEIGSAYDQHLDETVTETKFGNIKRTNFNKDFASVKQEPYDKRYLILKKKSESLTEHTPRKMNTNSKSDIENIYRSFLDSSNAHSKDSLTSTTGIGGLIGRKRPANKSDMNLHDAIKKHFESQGHPAIPFDLIGRQNNDVLNGTNQEKTSSKEMHANIHEITDILNAVRESSLQTPQFDLLNLASEGEKGYVELSYLVNYPKVIVYQPQYLVKNILQYDDFVKVTNELYLSEDDKQLLKIVRYLPNSSTQTLFETKDLKSPLKIEDHRNEKEDITNDRRNSPKIDTSTSRVPSLRQLISNNNNTEHYELEHERQATTPTNFSNIDASTADNIKYPNTQDEDVYDYLFHQDFVDNFNKSLQALSINSNNDAKLIRKHSDNNTTIIVDRSYNDTESKMARSNSDTESMVAHPNNNTNSTVERFNNDTGSTAMRSDNATDIAANSNNETESKVTHSNNDTESIGVRSNNDMELNAESPGDNIKSNVERTYNDRESKVAHSDNDTELIAVRSNNDTEPKVARSNNNTESTAVPSNDNSTPVTESSSYETQSIPRHSNNDTESKAARANDDTESVTELSNNYTESIARANNDLETELEPGTNSTESKYGINEPDINILNATSLTRTQIGKQKNGNETSPLIAKPHFTIDEDSIADYLRYNMSDEEVLSAATHAYLKELEAQGVSASSLTKIMMAKWWETWKNKLRIKVQSIAARVSNLLKLEPTPISLDVKTDENKKDESDDDDGRDHDDGYDDVLES